MQAKNEGKFLKNLLRGDLYSRHINITKLWRQTNYRNMSIKTLKCDSFYVGVDKTITPGENLT